MYSDLNDCYSDDLIKDRVLTNWCVIVYQLRITAHAVNHLFTCPDLIILKPAL